MIVVRRRSFAVGLVTAQALLLAVIALGDATGGGDVGAAARSRVRGVALAVLFLFVVSRTREPRPVRSGIAPFVRAGIAVSFALALTWLVPTIGLDSRTVERAVIALVAFGIAAVATPAGDALPGARDRARRERAGSRRAGAPGGSSLAIELGVALDLTLVALVAAVFHERIFAEFGAGDTAALRSLRD